MALDKNNILLGGPQPYINPTRKNDFGKTGYTDISQTTPRQASNPQVPDSSVTAPSNSAKTRDFRVSLRSSKRLSSLVDLGNQYRVLNFDVTPEITENRQVSYKSLDPVHMPGNIYVYGNTMSRTFQVSNAKLISTCPEEASYNMGFLHTLRGWTMPFFGKSDTSSFSNSQGGNRLDKFNPQTLFTQSGGSSRPDVLGMPPEVLLFSAYSPNADFGIGYRNFPTNIYRIPVIITNLTIPYTSEIDYIPTMDGQPFPRIITIDIQLGESHAPKEYENFSLSQYRQGVLDGF